MSTDQAVSELLHDDDRYLEIWLRKGRTKQDRYYLRKRHKEGKLSLDLREKLLEDFGFEVQCEKSYVRPKRVRRWGEE